MILRTVTKNKYTITSLIPDDNLQQEIKELKNGTKVLGKAIEIKNAETEDIYYKAKN